MSCLVCGEEKTIKAHLIPRAFAKEVALNVGEKHVITNSTGDQYTTTDTGRFDDGILCGRCDGIIGQYEGTVFNILCKARDSKPRVNSILECDPLDGDIFVRFAAGVAWKYCVTKPSFGRIEIGPYSNVLREIAFKTLPIPPSIDVSAIYLQDGSSDVFFYRTPMPDRKFQVNVVRFSVGGFVFFLKTDKRPNPSFPPQECWLRGKTRGAFAIAPADTFEEWTKHGNARQHPRLKGYFHRMATKSKSGSEK
jgi:hypothetical protein